MTSVKVKSLKRASLLPSEKCFDVYLTTLKFSITWTTNLIRPKAFRRRLMHLKGFFILNFLNIHEFSFKKLIRSIVRENEGQCV